MKLNLGTKVRLRARSEGRLWGVLYDSLGDGPVDRLWDSLVVDLRDSLVGSLLRHERESPRL